tara:strand:+ start:4683 stop:5573 length:891 start_codon:yes stop_codon:yes gene_type:complete
MKFLFPFFALLFLLVGCQSGLTEEEFQEVIGAVKNASRESIPEDIMEGVDINSPKGVFLSYRIALQTYNKDEFKKYASSEGVTLVHDPVQLQINNDNFEETILIALLYIPTLDSINISNETISEPFAYVNLKEKFNKFNNGQVKLIREDSGWRVLNETWIFKLPTKPVIKSTKEWICESKILELSVVLGETKICQKSDDSERIVEFFINNNHGRYYVYALNVTVFGENQNDEYILENTPIEPGFAVFNKVTFNTLTIGNPNKIKISPHITLGEYNYSCSHKNSSIEMNFNNVKECK